MVAWMKWVGCVLRGCCGGLEVRDVRCRLAELRVEFVHAGFPETELLAQGFKVVVG